MPPKRGPKGAVGNGKDADGNAVATVQVTLVTELGPNDVLMGRGALATDYEGNLRLREIVHLRQEEYSNAAKRNRKHRIAEEIVAAVGCRGGRFLQSAETLSGLDPSTLPKHAAAWYVVTDRQALISKVKQLLRDVKPRKKSVPPRQEQEAKPSQIVLHKGNGTQQSHQGTTTAGTSGTPATEKPTESSHAFPPALPLPSELNFLWRSYSGRDVSASPSAARPVHSSHKASALVGSGSVLSEESSESSQYARVDSGNGQGSGLIQRAPSVTAPSSANTQQQQQQQQTQQYCQNQNAVSQTTSMLGHANASTILQNLLSGNASRDQQYDAILALSLASQMAPPGHSSTPTSQSVSQQPTRPPAPMPVPAPSPVTNTSAAVTVLAAALVAQQQQRERERSLVDALLTHLLPHVRSRSDAGTPQPTSMNAPAAHDVTNSSASVPFKTAMPSAPLNNANAGIGAGAGADASARSTASHDVAPLARPSSAAPDPSMAWLFNQLQSRANDRTASAPTATRPEGNPFPTQGASTYSDLNTFLRHEQSTPRAGGILGDPPAPPPTGSAPTDSRLAVLERLLLSRDSWSQQPDQQPVSSQMNTPDEALVQVLRALQRQYFAPPS